MYQSIFLLKSFFYIFILLFSGILFGQDPYSHLIDKNLGLPSNSVYDVFQDSKGFMWFATNKGISKYDGSRFTTYTSPEQTSVSGSNISEDQFGRIWYCNFDGYLYYVENEQLKQLKQTETIGYFRFGVTENHLYLIQKNKVLIYDLKSLKPIASQNIDGNIIYHTFSDSKEFYVLADVLYAFSGTKTVKKYPVPPNLKKNYSAPIFQKTENGLVIVSKSQHSFYTFQNGNFTEKKFSTEINNIQNINFIDGEIWISTTNGIFRNALSPNKNEVHYYFADDNISSIFKDRQNNYWISTLNKGVLLLKDFDSKFIAMQTRPILLENYGENVLVSTEKDQLFTLSKNNFELQKIYQGTSNHAISQLNTQDQDKIFFTSSQFKIYSKSSKKQKAFSVAVKDVNKIDDTYFAFSASGMSGILKVNSKTQSKWTNVFNLAEKTNAGFEEAAFLTNSNGKSNCYNPTNNTIYYATNIGLFAKNLQNLTELQYNGKRLYISKIKSYKNSVFALATNGKLYQIDEKNNIKNFNIPENIAKESISKIKILSNTLYIFGEKSLYEYDFLTRKFQKTISGSSDFDISDIIISGNKKILATSKGLLILNDANREKINNPKLLITEIFVNNQSVSEKKLQHLTNTENNLKIMFSALSFIPTQKPEIWYRINEKNWQTLGNENRDLVLNSLSFGKYTLEYRTKTEEQFSPIQRLDFSISKPFWLKIWFILPVILASLFLLYLFYLSQIKKIEKQNQLV